MELRHLEALVEVVRNNGFSTAARALDTTQSTISKAIRQLEHDCGAVLLERLGQGVRPTAAGETVFRRGVAMLREREHLKAELADQLGLVTGKLRLGLPALGSSVLFAPLVATYRQRYPGVEIELHEHGSRELEASVRAGEIELGATLDPVADDFEWQVVREDPLIALLPPAHPLAGRAEVRLRELVRSPLVLFERGFALNELIEAACRRRRLSWTEAARGGHADFVVALVASGLGVGMLPEVEVRGRRDLSVATAKIDETDLHWRLGLIWRRAATLSPAARKWVELVREKTPAAAPMA